MYELYFFLYKPLLQVTGSDVCESSELSPAMSTYNCAMLPLILAHFFPSHADIEDSWVCICLVL